jgi:hypothetical protein
VSGWPRAALPCAPRRFLLGHRAPQFAHSRLASGAYRMAVSGNSAPQSLLQRLLLQSRSDWG